MPTVSKRKSTRNGRKVEQWRWAIRKAGYPVKWHTCPEGVSKSEAREQALEYERDQQIGKLPTLQQKKWRDWTLQKLIDKYLESQSTKPLAIRKLNLPATRFRLYNFLEKEPVLARKPILTITMADIQEYCNRMLDTGIKSSTLRRDYLTPISSMWNKYAVSARGLAIPLQNIFKVGEDGLELPDNPSSRKRILKLEERPRLFRAINGCRGRKQQELWLSLVLAALHTSLRRSALLKLQWGHIDFENKKLWALPVKKEKEGRWLPMTRFLGVHLELYYDTLEPEKKTPNSRVFPITPTAHEQAWKRIVKRAGLYEIKEDGKIDYLHFHDLRKTALSWFAMKNPERLDLRENAYMKGMHYTDKTLEEYEILDLIEDIRTKLDAKEETYALEQSRPGGKGRIHPDEMASVKHWARHQGLWQWE